MEIKYTKDEITKYKNKIKSLNHEMMLEHDRYMKAKSRHKKEIAKVANHYLKPLDFKVGDYIAYIDNRENILERGKAFGGNIKSAIIDEDGLTIVLENGFIVTITDDVTFIAHHKQEDL